MFCILLKIVTQNKKYFFNLFFPKTFLKYFSLQMSEYLIVSIKFIIIIMIHFIVILLKTNID